MADFALQDSPKLFSRKNLNDRKIMKFPYCVFHTVSKMIKTFVNFHTYLIFLGKFLQQWTTFQKTHYPKVSMNSSNPG